VTFQSDHGLTNQLTANILVWPWPDQSVFMHTPVCTGTVFIVLCLQTCKFWRRD
jgi:hypothetical protein